MSARQFEMRTDLESGAAPMARGAGVNLLGSVGATVLAFAFVVVITQFVSASDIGFYWLATTVVALALVPALLGLDTGVIRFVALGAAVDDELRARAALQAAIVLAALTSTAMAIAIWWFAPWIAGTLFDKPEATRLLRVVSISLPALATGRVLIAGIRGFGVMTYAAWLGILARALDIATALPLLALGFGVVGLAWASVFAAFASSVAGLALLLRVHPRALKAARRAWPTRPLLRFSLPQTLTSVFFFGAARVDLLLLARFGAAAEVGVYAIAGRVLLPATLVSTAIGQMFAPRVAAGDARGDRSALASMLKRVTYWNTALSLPVFAVLLVAAEPILELFGPVYAEGATALSILAVGQLLNTAAGPLGQFLNMSGRPYITMVNNAFVAVMSIGLGVFLIPRHGMTGAAISTALALLAGNVLKLIQVWVIFGIHPFRRDSVTMFGSGSLAVIVALPVMLLPPWPSSLMQACVVVLVVFAIYGLAMKVGGLTQEDRELVASGRVQVLRMLHVHRS